MTEPVKVTLVMSKACKNSMQFKAVGEEKAELTGKVEGENNKIALNSQYLLDVLKFIQTDEVTLELDDKLSPAVIRITKESEKTYMYIIMPLKI